MGRLFTIVIVLLVSATLLSTSSLAITGKSDCEQAKSVKMRPHSVSITEFGAVGDGVTLNTKAFQNAMLYLNSMVDKGGATLFVPAGRWLTGSFQIVSHLTLWLDENAVILGSTNSDDWPVVAPLPSYGRGRELPGKRHRSLIYGENLTDVVITGNNGTIDGQGSIWWNWFHTKTLNYTRPHLVELMHSTRIVISNLTFINSPFWTIHPVYCRNVNVHNMTILAPPNSPNTDGIDPDSSEEVCIEDCFISTGDDLIAIKSGWDEYGISYGRPSRNILIRGLIGQTRNAGIAIGSEMSGGVSEVTAENLHFYNTSAGIHIKTSPGRGGYVRNIFISNVTLNNVNRAIWYTGHYGEHPDDHYDANALPAIDRVTITNVMGHISNYAGLLEGIEGDVFRCTCLANISLDVSSKTPWNCSYVQGYSDEVYPETCEPLREKIFPDHYSKCYHL